MTNFCAMAWSDYNAETGECDPRSLSLKDGETAADSASQNTRSSFVHGFGVGAFSFAAAAIIFKMTCVAKKTDSDLTRPLL